MVAGPGRDWPREVRGACPPPPTPAPGMEVAAYLTEKAHSVSVVELEETPFRRFLGERVGRALMKVSPPWRPAPSPSEPQALSHPRPPCLPPPPQQMFENNRVKFYMQTEVSELRAQEGKVGPASCPPLSRSQSWGAGPASSPAPPHS